MITDVLIPIYITLIGWTLFGVFFLRSLPQPFAKGLGKLIYWFGVPLRIFAFTLKSDLNFGLVWVPAIVVGGLVCGSFLTWIATQVLKPEERSSFWLSSLLTNTGSIGLSITPYFVPDQFLGWAVLFTLFNNVLGSYGLGVLIANHFSPKEETNSWKAQAKALFSSPALWAFSLGIACKTWEIGTSSHETIVWIAKAVAPLSLVLVGLRLQQVEIKTNLVPMLPAMALKMIAMPLLTATIATVVGITGPARLALALQSGMPTAFASLVLAETYQLPTVGVVTSIVVTSGALLLMLPCWVWLLS